MIARRLHPVIDGPHRYDIVAFAYHVDAIDPLQSSIDMTLQRGLDIVRLRFLGPRQLAIEPGFPVATRGMVFYDRSDDGLKDIGVEVADFEGSHGSITFFAAAVIRL